MRLFAPRELSRRQSVMPLVLWFSSAFFLSVGVIVGALVAGEVGAAISAAVGVAFFAATIIVFIWCLLVDTV